MGVFISGRAFLSNGQTPNCLIRIPGRFKLKNRADTYEYHLTILGGCILLEFTSDIQVENRDELFVIARHAVDLAILSCVVLEGVGIVYTLEHIGKERGSVVPCQIDRAPTTGLETLQREELFPILMESTVRYALRDFNSGLINREDSPFLFYRSIETIAKAILRKEEKLEPEEWARCHQLLGTTRDDLKTVEEFSTPHRHGNHTAFNGEQQLAMMKETKYFLLKALAYLKTTQNKG